MGHNKRKLCVILFHVVLFYKIILFCRLFEEQLKSEKNVSRDLEVKNVDLRHQLVKFIKQKGNENDTIIYYFNFMQTCIDRSSFLLTHQMAG